RRRPVRLRRGDFPAAARSAGALSRLAGAGLLGGRVDGGGGGQGAGPGGGGPGGEGSGLDLFGPVQLRLAGDCAAASLFVNVLAAIRLDAFVPGGADSGPVVLCRLPVGVAGGRIVVVELAVGADDVLQGDGGRFALVALGRAHLHIVLDVD